MRYANANTLGGPPGAPYYLLRVTVGVRVRVRVKVRARARVRLG